MKKILALLLAACLLLALTACGGDANTNSDPAPTQQPAATQQPAGNGSDTQPTDNGSDVNADTGVTDVPDTGSTAPDVIPAETQTELPAEGSILALCGLTAADLRTPAGTFAIEPIETDEVYMACIDCGDTSFETFESWLNALADSCRSAAKDGIIYEPNFFEPESVEPLEAFELEPGAINIVQFAYKTDGHEIYVTAADTGTEEVENAFSCYLSVY